MHGQKREAVVALARVRSAEPSRGHAKFASRCPASACNPRGRSRRSRGPARSAQPIGNQCTGQARLTALARNVPIVGQWVWGLSVLAGYHSTELLPLAA